MDYANSDHHHTPLFEMASLLKILGLSMWLYLASQGSTTVGVFSHPPPNVANGTVHIDGGSPIGTTDEDFICATMDLWPPSKCDYGKCSWGNASLLNIDLNNTILLNAITAFSPLKIRLGGTLQDKLIYQTTNSTPCLPFAFTNSSSELFGFTQGCLPMSRWDDLNNFFKLAGAKIIFGLNALTGRKVVLGGTSTGAWNYSNAEFLIKYTVDHNYSIYGWELGNELSGTGIGTNVSADQYVSDVIKLRHLVKEIYKNSTTDEALVLGPGGFFKKSWFTKFVKGTANYLQVATHHIYNLGAGVDDHLVEKILNPSFLDQEAQTFSDLQKILESYGKSTVGWVGESGGAYNSGRDLVTNAFVFSFWYLDQLGMSSSYDTKTYCRQSLIGGNYGFLDTNTFVPNPDFYSALLWHRLMGRTVLSTNFTGPKSIRAYAHCSKNNSGGGVTLLLINLDKSTAVQVDLDIHNKAKTNSSRSHYQRDEYHLTAKGGELHSRVMLLNGVEISVDSSGTIPPLKPNSVDDSEPITVAPLSILFARIPSIEVPACK